MRAGQGARVYLGLGSNLGDREVNLVRALEKLETAFTLEALSALYETEPQGFADQPWFYNAAVGGRTDLGPEAALGWLKGVEQEIGRVPSFPQGPRLIDIDILLWEGVEVSRSEVVIPHPRLSERAFVLAPLAELAPGLVVRGKTVGDWLAQARGEVRRRDWRCLPDSLCEILVRKGVMDV